MQHFTHISSYKDTSYNMYISMHTTYSTLAIPTIPTSHTICAAMLFQQTKAIMGSTISLMSLMTNIPFEECFIISMHSNLSKYSTLKLRNHPSSECFVTFDKDALSLIDNK